MSNYYLAKAMPNAMSNVVFVGHDNGTDQIPKNIMIFLKLNKDI